MEKSPIFGLKSLKIHVSNLCQACVAVAVLCACFQLPPTPDRYQILTFYGLEYLRPSEKIPLFPYPPINSFFLLGFHLYLPGILFHYSLLCLYCKIFRFLLGCFLTGTSSVPHSPVLSFQGQSKGQGWEVLERVKVMVRKWGCQEGAPPLGMEESGTRWEIGAGWVPVDHAVDVYGFVGRPEIRNCDASDFSPS